MTFKELIEEFQKYANNLNINDNIEYFNDNLVQLQDILNDINNENDRRQIGYYIAINDIGPDDDFTRYYTPIGKMSKEEALRVLDTLGCKSMFSTGWDDCIKQVSKEEYEEWYALAIYSTMLSYSKWPALEYRITEDKLYPIEDRVLKLRNHLGLSHRWEVVRLYRK